MQGLLQHLSVVARDDRLELRGARICAAAVPEWDKIKGPVIACDHSSGSRQVVRVGGQADFVENDGLNLLVAQRPGQSACAQLRQGCHDAQNENGAYAIGDCRFH